MATKKPRLTYFLENIGSYSPMTFSNGVFAQTPNLKDEAPEDKYDDPFNNLRAFYGQSHERIKGTIEQEEETEEEQEEKVRRRLFSLLDDDSDEEDESRPADIIDRQDNNAGATQTANTWTRPPDEFEREEHHSEFKAAMHDLRQELADRRDGVSQPQLNWPPEARPKPQFNTADDEEEESLQHSYREDHDVCVFCNGTGKTAKDKKCPYCKGHGVQNNSQRFYPKNWTLAGREDQAAEEEESEEEEFLCTTCDGSGFDAHGDRCSRCKGTGITNTTTPFDNAHNDSRFQKAGLGAWPTCSNYGHENEEKTEWEEDEADTKQDRARQMFTSLINQGKSRQDIIDQFMKQIGVTNSTAVSYYQRLAKEAGLTTSGDRDMPGAGPSGLGVAAGQDVNPLHYPGGAMQTAAPDDETESNVEGFEVEDNPNRQGLIRTVPDAHLVYKRKQEDGTFDELWVFKAGSDMKDALKTRRAILAGTDIPPKSTKSQDGSQSYTLTSLGNGQLLHIKGLPN